MDATTRPIDRAFSYPIEPMPSGAIDSSPVEETEAAPLLLAPPAGAAASAASEPKEQTPEGKLLSPEQMAQPVRAWNAKVKQEAEEYLRLNSKAGYRTVLKHLHAKNMYPPHLEVMHFVTKWKEQRRGKQPDAIASKVHR